MVLPIIWGIVGLFSALDLGVVVTTGKDSIEHLTGFSPWDYLLDPVYSLFDLLLGTDGGGAEAPPEVFDVYGMLIYAALLAIGVIAIWAYFSSSKKQKRRG